MEIGTVIPLYIFLALLLALVYSQVVLFLRVRRMSNHKVAEAARLEAQGEYAEACLQYALALINNPSRPADCREHIRDLWRRFGPFDYQARLAAGPDCSPMSCADAVALIESIVAHPSSDTGADHAR